MYFTTPILLNNNLKLQPEWITDDATGKITGYRFRGADTVFPFSSLENFVRIKNLTSNTSSPYVDFSVVPGTWRGFHGQYPETVFYKVVNSPNDNTYWVGTGSKINIKLKKEIRAMALSIHNYDYKAGNVFPALIKNISNVTKICDYAVFSPICGVGGTISIDFCASPEWLEINDFSLYILL